MAEYEFVEDSESFPSFSKKKGADGVTKKDVAATSLRNKAELSKGEVAQSKNGQKD